MFGQFKTKLGDEFTTANTGKLTAYFDLSPTKLEDIEQSKRPGIQLLTILENDEVIGEDIGIGKLCEALDYCSLKRLARIARNTYDTLRKVYPDETDDAAVHTGQSLDQLKATLQDQLTQDNCSEIAMYFGRPGIEPLSILENDEVIGEDIGIGKSSVTKTSTAEVEMFGQFKTNLGDAFTTANTRGFTKLEDIEQSERPGIEPLSILENDEVIGEDIGIGKSSVTKTSTAEEVISKCICGRGDFDELVSLRSEMISIQCCACKAEWLKASSSSGKGIALLRNDIKFYYKVPLNIDEAKLKHEIVKNVKQLEPGDHIVMRRAETWDHHAIFILESNGRMQVIHWTTNILNKLKALTNPEVKFAEIKFEWKEFPEEVRRVLYPEEDPPYLVIARANKLYQSKGHHHYSLTDNNCETLSTYCKIGKGFSTQAGVV